MNTIPKVKQIYFDSTVYCYPGNEYLDFEIVFENSTQILSEDPLGEELSIITSNNSALYINSKQILLVCIDKVGSIIKLLFISSVVIIGLKNSYSGIYTKAFLQESYLNVAHFASISVPLGNRFFTEKGTSEKEKATSETSANEGELQGKKIGNISKSIHYDAIKNAENSNTKMIEMMEEMNETNKNICNALNNMTALLQTTNTKLTEISQLQKSERATEIVEVQGKDKQKQVVRKVVKKETWKEFIKRNVIKYSKWTLIYIVCHLLIPSSKDP